MTVTAQTIVKNQNIDLQPKVPANTPPSKGPTAAQRASRPKQLKLTGWAEGRSDIECPDVLAPLVGQSDIGNHAHPDGDQARPASGLMVSRCGGVRSCTDLEYPHEHEQPVSVRGAEGGPDARECVDDQANNVDRSRLSTGLLTGRSPPAPTISRRSEKRRGNSLKHPVLSQIPPLATHR